MVTHPAPPAPPSSWRTARPRHRRPVQSPVQPSTPERRRQRTSFLRQEPSPRRRRTAVPRPRPLHTAGREGASHRRARSARTRR